MSAMQTGKVYDGVTAVKCAQGNRSAPAQIMVDIEQPGQWVRGTLI